MNQNIITVIVIIISLFIILIIMPLTYFYTTYVCTRRGNVLITPSLGAQIECPQYIKMNDKEIIGLNIGTMPIKNINENQCQKMCQEQNCVWYNYNQRNNLCWLKRGNPQNDYLTGIRVPRSIKIDACPSFYIYDNMDINGSNTKSYKQISQAQCQILCDQEECDWYGYNKETKECSLKKGKEMNQVNVGFNAIFNDA